MRKEMEYEIQTAQATGDKEWWILTNFDGSLKKNRF